MYKVQGLRPFFGLTDDYIYKWTCQKEGRLLVTIPYQFSSWVGAREVLLDEDRVKTEWIAKVAR